MNRRRLLLGLLVALAFAALTFAYVLPKLAAYSAVWGQLRALSWPWLLGLMAVTALNLVTFAPPWMIALPRLGFRRALQMTQASTALGLVVPGGAPLGMAASFTILRTAGFTSSHVSVAVAITGIWNQVSTFLFPVVAIVLLAARGAASPTLRLAAALGAALSLVVAALVAGALWRAELSRRLGDAAARLATAAKGVIRRERVTWTGESLVRYRADMLALVRERWLPLTIATLANQLTGYLMFEISVLAVGIPSTQLSLVETFAAWSVARLLTSLPITPGGIGVVELGLTGMLVGFGAGHAPVVAAVLLYRALSIVPTVVFGIAAAATWRRQR